MIHFYSNVNTKKTQVKRKCFFFFFENATFVVISTFLETIPLYTSKIFNIIL